MQDSFRERGKTQIFEATSISTIQKFYFENTR